MKYKVLIILGLLIFCVFGIGITYSFFYSNSVAVSNGRDIAKFVFNAKSLGQIQLPLTDLKPGDINEYTFSVSNADSGVVSDVSIQYQLTIKTYHLAPLIINLYRIEGETEELILNCDETFTRNAKNELVCNTSTLEMNHSSETLDSYKIEVSFPNEYDGTEYADLVDYINLEIRSWQKTGD